MIPKISGEGRAAHETHSLDLRADPSSTEVQHKHRDFKNHGLEVDLGYRKCREHDAQGTSGQDFAVLRTDGVHVVGIAADGVSQSFHGELAAREVSERLLEHLWDLRSTPPSEERLTATLLSWTPEIQRLVLAIPTGADLPPLVQGAVKKARLDGSQTVFGAFVLGRVEGTLHLYLVGDVQAWIALADGHWSGVTGSSRGRWSSTGEAPLLLESRILRNVTRCVIHSDGLGEDWNLSPQGFERVAEEKASDDDLCFVAVAAHAQPVIEPPLPPDPPRRIIKSDASPPRRQAYWPLWTAAALVVGLLAGARIMTALLSEPPRQGPEPGLNIHLGAAELLDRAPREVTPAKRTPEWLIAAEPLDQSGKSALGGEVVLRIEAPAEVSAVEIWAKEKPIARWTPGNDFPTIQKIDALEMEIRALSQDGSVLTKQTYTFRGRSRNYPGPGENRGFYKIDIRQGQP